MKDAVTTKLHSKCCPARPPAYAALGFLHTNPSAFALCIFFTKSEKNEKKKDDGKDEDGDSGEDEEGDDADGHEDHDGHDDGAADSGGVARRWRLLGVAVGVVAVWGRTWS